ncbi:MAG TPA: tetratricopeptide repeat protein [Candidatus Binatia bacterium]|nr:tetratricopeptide repeat protein [Candidatus Binatia bacterium]
MAAPSIDSLRRMLDGRPDDTRIRFALALEYEKAGRWEDAAAELQRYLEDADDEGNAWGRLGNALRRLGRNDAAKAAYRTGVEAARRHGHPSMAAEFEETLEEWEDT